MYDIPQDRQKEYREAFDMFDKNKDGVIEVTELRNVMRSLNHDPTKEELEEMINEVDLDHNGYIDFDEFVILMNRRNKEADIEEDVINAFQVFESDKKGFISITDLRHIMATLGSKEENDQINEFLLEEDEDGDGYIDYEDFIRKMMST